METNRIKCTCSCHTKGGMQFLHMQACCNNGYIDMPVIKEKQYLTNKDFIKYYYEDLGIIEEQFNVEFNGQVEVNPEWEAVDNMLGGKTYTVKSKKDETQDKN